MKIIPSFSKRAYVLSGTLLALLAVFIFYLYIYIPQREDELIRQRIRGLEQTAFNFQAKWEVFNKNAEKISNQYENDPANGIKIELEQIIEQSKRKRDTGNVYENLKVEERKIKGKLDAINAKITRSGFNVNLEVGYDEDKVDADKNLVFVQNPTSNIVIKTGIDRFFESLKRPNDFDDYFISSCLPVEKWRFIPGKGSVFES